MSRLWLAVDRLLGIVFCPFLESGVRGVCVSVDDCCSFLFVRSEPDCLMTMNHRGFSR